MSLNLLIVGLEEELYTAEVGVHRIVVIKPLVTAITERSYNILEDSVVTADFPTLLVAADSIPSRFYNAILTDMTVSYPSAPSAFVFSLCAFVVYLKSSSFLVVISIAVLSIEALYSYVLIEAITSFSREQVELFLVIVIGIIR